MTERNNATGRSIIYHLAPEASSSKRSERSKIIAKWLSLSTLIDRGGREERPSGERRSLLEAVEEL